MVPQPALLVVCLGQKNSEAKESRPKVTAAWKIPGTHHGRGQILLLCVTPVDLGSNYCKPQCLQQGKSNKGHCRLPHSYYRIGDFLCLVFSHFQVHFRKVLVFPLQVRKRYTKIST